MADAMADAWERQPEEPLRWHSRFTLYRLLGAGRTLADAHRLAVALDGRTARHPYPTRAHPTWEEAAQRWAWAARAQAWDVALAAPPVAEEPAPARRAAQVERLLDDVLRVLHTANLPGMDQEEARALLPTLRMFLRDLLLFQREEAARAPAGVPLSADSLAALAARLDALQAASGGAREAAWLPLRDLLAEFYADEASARRIADEAGLDGTHIHFAPTALDTWHAILTEADHADRLDALLEVALREYGANPALRQAARRARHARAGTLPGV